MSTEAVASADAGADELSTRAHAAPGSFRELLWVALPLMLSAGTQSLMHVVDRVFLAWLSQDALAAALPAGLTMWTCLSMPYGIITYLNAFIAQFEGAGRHQRSAATMWQGMWLAVFAGAALMPLATFGWLFAETAQAPEVAHQEQIYFSVLCYGAIPALTSQALSCFFSGRGDSRTVLYVNIFSVALNAVLDYCLVFGVAPFPRWEIAGAAWATNIANLAATIVYLALLTAPRLRADYRLFQQWGLDWSLVWRILRYGFPTGLQLFLDVIGFNVFLFLLGELGKDKQAATVLAFNLNTLSFIPVIGLGIAVSTLVGQRIGEDRPAIARASAWKGFILGGGYMLLAGAIYVLFPGPLIAPYTWNADWQNFEETKATTAVLLRYVALYSFFDAMAILFGSAIRAAGDTLFSLVWTCIGAWGLLVLPVWLFWRSNQLTLEWAWFWCTVYVVVLGIGYWLRFLAGGWMKLKIIEPTPLE